MRILSNRSLASSLRPQACMCSKSSMSSTSKEPAAVKQDKELTKPKVLRDKPAGFFNRFVSAFTSYDHADPSKPNIPHQEIRGAHATDIATGNELLFQLAFENGFNDPYCLLPVSREGKGTKDNPVLLHSFAPETILACVCEPEQTFHRFMKIYADEPRRCQCGYWVKLVDAPRFWEKIPREDLLQIPYFQHLEEEGLLDDYLAGKVEEVQEKLGMYEQGHH